MRKAFTLVELLAVIIILGIIVLIATPIVNDVIVNSRQKAYDLEIETILNQALSYSVQEKLDMSGVIKSIQFDDLINVGLISKTPTDHVDGGDLEGCILYNWDTSINQFIFNYSESCDVPKVPYTDTILNGADPELTEGLIPVTISSNGDVTIVDGMEKWYDYQSQEWANAILLKNGQTANVGDVISLNSEGQYDEIAVMYVWIPRYEYKIFDVDSDISDVDDVQSINIRFVNDDVLNNMPETPILGEYYTHPVFTFGDTKISGFWVSKFEVTGNIDTPTSLPNVSALRGQSISSLFYSILDVDTEYGLTNNLNQVDSHMIKNMEWGAIAYLSYSEYGINEEIYMNNNSKYITGCSGDATSSLRSEICTNSYGSKDNDIYYQSTTGNISGVFDMSGGAWEYVMGNMVNSSGDFNFSASGFESSITLESKYYDSYAFGEASNEYNRGKYGDGTRETVNWNDDFAYVPYSYSPWFVRGGSYLNQSESGIFYSFPYYGLASDEYTTRLTLVVSE